MKKRTKAILAAVLMAPLLSGCIMGDGYSEFDPCPDCEKLEWTALPNVVMGEGGTSVKGTTTSGDAIEIHTTVEPALIVIDGRAYVAVTSFDGHVWIWERNVADAVTWNGTQSCWDYATNWDPTWTPPILVAPDAPSPGFPITLPPMFDADTPPVFAPRLETQRPVLLARGTDDVLYVSVREASGWTPWTALTDEGEVLGRIDAASTGIEFKGASTDEIHVVFPTAGGVGRLIVADGDFANPTRADERFKNLADELLVPSVASDGESRLVIAIASSGTREPMLLATARDSGFLIVETTTVAAPKAGTVVAWTGTSDIVYFSGDERFHALFGVTWDYGGTAGPVATTLHYAQSRDANTQLVGDDLYVYGEIGLDADVPPTLVDYRDRLIQAKPIPGAPVPDNSLEVLRWDDVPLETTFDSVWRNAGLFQGVGTILRPALATDGTELYGAVTDNDGVVRFVLLSRSMAFYRAHVELRLEVVFDDPTYDPDVDPATYRPVDGCFEHSAWETPIATEVGYGTWLIPEQFSAELWSAYVDAGMDEPGMLQSLQLYPVRVHATTNLGAAYFGQGIHLDPGMDYYQFLEEFLHKMAHALELDSTCADADEVGYGCAYGQDLPGGLPDDVVEDGRAIFAEDVGDLCSAEGRAPGFLGVALGNSNCASGYDAGDDQHSFIYALLYYMEKPGTFRGYIDEDLAEGNDLLERKYVWIREHIFDGAEFLDQQEMDSQTT